MTTEPICPLAKAIHACRMTRRHLALDQLGWAIHWIAQAQGWIGYADGEDQTSWLRRERARRWVSRVGREVQQAADAAVGLRPALTAMLQMRTPRGMA